ncbi:Embryo-specific protein [Balamuthia mandrillaris]
MNSGMQPTKAYLEDNAYLGWTGLLVGAVLGLGTAFLWNQFLGRRERSDVVGSRKTAESKMLETGSSMLQNLGPVNSIHLHLCGMHFYNGSMDRQIEAHHYCSRLSEDFHQCVIYDSNEPNARLIGIEYVISKKIYDQLDADEKKLWHSHVYEVGSGMLMAPGLPEAAEHKIMSHLIGTYGKTFHLWHVDQNPLFPEGIPQLMMAFTADGQIYPHMVKHLEKRLGQTMARKRILRRDIKRPLVDPLADSWQSGEVLQLRVMDVAQEAERVTPQLRM